MPFEATAALCMLLLRDHNMLTVHFVGVPPGGADLLIKFLPPETLARFGGAKKFAQALDASLTELGAMLREAGKSPGAAVRHKVVGARCGSGVVQREGCHETGSAEDHFRCAWTPLPSLLPPSLLVASLCIATAQERSRLDEVLQRGTLIVVTWVRCRRSRSRTTRASWSGSISTLHGSQRTHFSAIPTRSSSSSSPATDAGRQSRVAGPTWASAALRSIPTGRSASPSPRAFIDSGISILVAKSSGIKSLEDLNQEKFIVANLNNPQMADRAAAIFPKAKVITFDTPSGEFLAVKSGRAHALQIDTPTADYFAASSAKDFEVLPTLLTASQNNGIYLKPGDFKWWLWLDTFVSELRTGSLYPKYTELYQKWFKKDPPPQKFYLPPSR